MNRWVEIEFDCLPMRSINRWDVPMDASPKYRDFCQRLKAAHDKHGSHNTYFLHNARCTYHLTNQADQGMIEFAFEGIVLTDADDRCTRGSDLTIHLQRETCPWLTEPVVNWFRDSVRQAVEVEFDLYIQAGDLERTRLRIEKMQSDSDSHGGFLGMYL